MTPSIAITVPNLGITGTLVRVGDTVRIPALAVNGIVAEVGATYYGVTWRLAHRNRDVTTRFQREDFQLTWLAQGAS